jgi:uncharacterized protein YciI
MPLYAVIGLDRPNSTSLRDQERAAHRDFSRAHVDITRIAGALWDSDGNQCGTLKIFEAESADQLRAIYADEPFFKAGVYESIHIIEWRIAYYDNAFPAIPYPPAPSSPT